MSTLIVSAFATNNPQTMTLTNFMDVQAGDGMDPADPSFTDKRFATSLLKEGGTLALETFALRELLFPLLLNSTSLSATINLVSELNQIINTPGAVCEWQDQGLSQPTYFDLASGQFDVEYNFREAGQFYVRGKLRIFGQPMGRTAGPRKYATASAVGPLLMVSPFFAGGGKIIGASTQAGVAGFGGQQQASGGVFYWGNPSLAGDAPAQVQISYAGPQPAGASNLGVIPYVAVSVLPDGNYYPLVPAQSITAPGGVFGVGSTAVASGYWRVPSPPVTFTFFPLANQLSPPIIPPLTWAGNHRLFAIARASSAAGTLSTLPTQMVPYTTTATVYPGDWQLLDLGVFQIRASQAPPQNAYAGAIAVQSGTTGVVDLTALVMLPDSSTWFLNPAQISPSAYGAPSQGLYTSTLLLDDVVGDQFVANWLVLPAGIGKAQAVPSVAGQTDRITQYTRGLVPRPDPRNGLPPIAILGVGQAYQASNAYYSGASWVNPQNSLVSAEVRVVDRARYVLP